MPPEKCNFDLCGGGKATCHYHNNTHTHTHLFNGLFSRTTWVSRYQKVKPIWILLKQETVGGSGISWAICKSAPCSRQITTPLFFLQAGCPSCHTTNSVKALKAAAFYNLFNLLCVWFILFGLYCCP